MATKSSEQEWVETLKALADNNRLRILHALLEGPMSVGALAEAAGVSPYNASKHLRILRGVNIVAVTHSGTRRDYAIADAFRKRISKEQVLDLGCCTFRLGQLGE